MKKNKGFTLVEVLICVGIIGIIAAITIPALLTSTNEKALEVQRKALHSRMAQAFGQIKNLKLYENSTSSDTGGSVEYTDQGSAMQFLINGLSKVYKLSSICDIDSLSDCGIPDVIHDYWSDTSTYNFDLTSKQTLTELNNSITAASLDNLKAKFAGFKTANGESILLYYNPKCKSKTETSPHNLIYSVCFNMIYDLNGKNKAPNAYGEDIGYITVFYPNDSSVVMPVLYNEKKFETATYNEMLSNATKEDLVPPTIEELVSILVNKELTNITHEMNADDSYWSSSYSSEGTSQVWVSGLNDGIELVDLVKDGSDTKRPYFLVKK